MGIDFRKATFIQACGHIPNYPKNGLPEIAVVGRSNVGKSALLNHLFFSKKGIAPVSSKPGKTCSLHFFNIDDQLMIADLPGYGFAKQTTNLRRKWGDWITAYFETREPLKLVLILLDIRHLPSRDDQTFCEWALSVDLPLVIVFTKSDKVKHGQQKRQINAILSHLQLEEASYIVSSAKNRQGRSELIAAILRKLDESTQT